MWGHIYILWGINPDFSGLSPCTRQIAYALRTRAPVSRKQASSTPRLACVRPAASVHPEPGSNSSSYILILLRSLCQVFLFSIIRVLTLSLCCQSNMSMNVSFLFLNHSLSPQPCGICLSKRVQNYNFFSIAQAFFKKKISFYFPKAKPRKLQWFLPFRFPETGRQRYIVFPLSSKSFCWFFLGYS